jgi:hypothetical protein
MISLDKQKETSLLKVGYTKIRADENGVFIIPRSKLLPEDLRLLPSGTEIVINYGDEHGRTAEDPIMLNMLQLIDGGKVSVMGNHYRCPCCWDHAMSFEKYTEIVAKIFEDKQHEVDGFTFQGLEISKQDEPLHFFSYECQSGNFKDVEQEVMDRMAEILKPLFDIRDSFDNQIKKRFGV